MDGHAKMESLRQHSITFTFSPNIKSSIINWIKQVQEFLPLLESTAEDDDLNSQNTIKNTVAPPFFHVEQVLETTAVQLSTILVSKLGHPLPNIRGKSATLLTQLAAILDEKFICNDSKTDTAIGAFMGDNYEDNYSRVNHLFQLIGKSLNLIVVALVAGMECALKDSDWHTRGIINTALVRLVFENDKTFQEDDNLAAIWNLFFLLGTMPTSSIAAQDRIVIIKGLGLLAPIYVLIDPNLARNIVESLLKLKIKVSIDLLKSAGFRNN